LDLRPQDTFPHAITFQIGAREAMPVNGLYDDIPPKPDSDTSEWARLRLSHNQTYGNRLTPALVSHFPRASGPNQWMLDIGCGKKGKFSMTSLCKEVTQFNYLGVDIDGPDADVLADAHALPFNDESFDFVVSFGVLQDLAFPDVAMCEVFRVLKRGGLFIATTAFIEPHMTSYFHMSHKGVYRVLLNAGFEVVALAPNRQWPGLRALAELSLFPIIPRWLKRALVIPADLTSSFLWALKRAVKGRERASDDWRMLQSAGGFRFVARRQP
jgi:ubiquinone/menaquinone biosynthesis C-methylase UbiE